MKRDSVKILNTRIDNLSMSETINTILQSILRGEHIHHSVVNAGKIVSMHHDIRLRESVNQADIINADGQSVVWASRLLGKPIKERVAGIDLMINLVDAASSHGFKIYLLGATDEVLNKIVANYQRQYGWGFIVGYRNGYFGESEAREIAQEIASCGAQMLFVAITSPKKEHFLAENKEILHSVPFIMGVGGSFDVISGKIKRAPRWLQKAGCEWLFRLIQEPGRMWKRYIIGNSQFIALVIKQRLMELSSR